MADYPSSLTSYTTKTNQVDDVDAAHINSIQEEVVAIQTELGTDPAGTVTDVKTRLAVCLGGSGAIRTGSSFPGTTEAAMIFIRSDEDKFYFRNAADSAWVDLTPSHATGSVLAAQSEQEVVVTTSGPQTTRVKEIVVPQSGTISVQFDVWNQTYPGETVWGRIYRNGSPIGTQYTVGSDETWETKGPEDISGWSAGDLLQLYVYHSGGASTGKARNLYLYLDTGVDFITTYEPASI